MAPERLAHLIFPDLSLAFVTSTQEVPWPHRAYRRLRLDAMADQDAYRINRPRPRLASVPNVTCSAARIDELSGLLVRNGVTPAALNDVLSDWL